MSACAGLDTKKRSDAAKDMRASLQRMAVFGCGRHELKLLAVLDAHLPL